MIDQISSMIDFRKYLNDMERLYMAEKFSAFYFTKQ